MGRRPRIPGGILRLRVPFYLKCCRIRDVALGGKETTKGTRGSKGFVPCVLLVVSVSPGVSSKHMPVARRFRSVFLVLVFVAQAGAYTQHERQISSPSEQDSDYGAKFFDELKRIFGRFRDADLRRVFDSA